MNFFVFGVHFSMFIFAVTMQLISVLISQKQMFSLSFSGWFMNEVKVMHCLDTSAVL